MSVEGYALEESALSGPPYVHAWSDADKPLRPRVIRAARGGRRTALIGAPPPWLPTGPVGEAFDFSEHVRRLCANIVARCEVLRHIDVSRLLFTVTQARSNRLHGLQARVTPLRFRGGALERRRWGTNYRVQRYFVSGTEMLYVVAFCLPRFLDQDFDSKLVTLFHELYHIGPAFDGDLRRHDGRYSIHSHSKRSYDQLMEELAREYLANGADHSLNSFLRLNFSQLQHRHGAVVGLVVPRPKLIPLPTKKRKELPTPSAKHE